MTHDITVINFENENPKNRLCKNLTHLMNECKITLHELFRNTGIPVATIQRIKTDPKHNPTVSTLKPIAEFFSITVSQLIGEEPLSRDRPSGLYMQKTDSWIKIPVINWEQAIDWPIVEVENSNLTTISTDIDVGGNAFALQIYEDDWISFQKESIIIIDPNLAPENKDYVIVHKNGVGTATLKRYLIYDNVAYLHPLNNNFKTVEFNEEYRILGVVIQIRKDIRK